MLTSPHRIRRGIAKRFKRRLMEDQDDSTNRFEQYALEYREALTAFETIKAQAETLLMMGNADELKTFIDRFIEMAARAAARADADGLVQYADSFLDLVQRGENFRRSVVPEE
jgi:hypothetical protein